MVVYVLIRFSLFMILFQSNTSCCAITLSRWLPSEYPKSSKLQTIYISTSIWTLMISIPQIPTQFITPKSYYNPYITEIVQLKWLAYISLMPWCCNVWKRFTFVETATIWQNMHISYNSNIAVFKHHKTQFVIINSYCPMWIWCKTHPQTQSVKIFP